MNARAASKSSSAMRSGSRTESRLINRVDNHRSRPETPAIKIVVAGPAPGKKIIRLK